MTPDDDDHSVLYEVNLEADAAIEGPFDTWLRDHIADLLQFDGFRSAEIFDDPTAPDGRVRRIVQYRLRNQAALDDYLQHHAPRMRARGVELFGDRFHAERRVLAHREEFIRGKVSTENCLNCGEVLRGQHCSHCGQRAKVRVLSLGGLLRDVFDDVMNFDSRFWRTLRPLAFRPGQLTVEYLRGRRVYYTPPFRMYLILSVSFFLATSIGADPGGALRLNLGEDSANLTIEDGPAAKDGAAAPAAKQDATQSKAPPKLDPDRQKVVDDIVSHLPEKDQARARSELATEFANMKPADVAAVKKVVDDPCGEQNFKVDIGPAGEKYVPRLRDACRKIVTDSKGFGRALYDNIPKMMFIFLPLIAVLMWVLYLGSGRYYVEHLLFFVHFHAFFFLGGLLIVVLDRCAALFQGSTAGGWLKGAGDFATLGMILYVPYYLYRAMRRVYGQGRFWTLVKFSVLGVGYLFFLTLTAIGLLFYTALTL